MRISDWSSDVCSSDLIDHMSLMMRMIVFILSQYSSCVDRHDLDRRRTASLRSIEPARHRLKNPFTMSKCRWAGPKPCQNPSEDGNLCLHICKIADSFRRQATQNGGAYRHRNADPLLAKQVSSQLHPVPKQSSRCPEWWDGQE